MAADDGGMFWVGQPLTTPLKKKDCGLKMAADSGSVFFGGIPLTRREKDRGRSETKKRRDWDDGVGNVAFNWIIII